MHEFIYLKALIEAYYVTFTDLVKESPIFKRKKLFETRTVSSSGRGHRVRPRAESGVQVAASGGPQGAPSRACCTEQVLNWGHPPCWWLRAHTWSTTAVPSPWCRGAGFGKEVRSHTAWARGDRRTEATEGPWTCSLSKPCLGEWTYYSGHWAQARL